ncbi:MAG: TIM-barrel domain-containing protein [Chloroflexota bacterium]
MTRRLLVVMLLGLVVALISPLGNAISSLALSNPLSTPEPPRPPLTPRWAYEPWVWEDEENDADATVALVDGYLQRDIPVGAVIVDSPWQTNYNTFEMSPEYGDPTRLVSRLRDRNIRVIFWATGFININSNDGPGRGISPNYHEALARGYFVNGGLSYEWDKGEGSAVDFFNPDAVAWWYTQMDKAWAYGIDGWKVDSPEGNLPDKVQTAAGWKTNREYGDQYYRAFYRYVADRDPDAIIMARPVDTGTVYAPVEANPAGWVGDQEADWGPRGIEEALDNILESAALGFSMLGSDIGGYRPGERFDRLFVRWAQLGALSPLMENGGRGEHRPWKLDEDLTATYRYFAKLHHQLVPYLYGHGVAASEGGQPIIRDGDRSARHYLLGEDLFVAPIVTRDDSRQVELPGDSRWYDYWDDIQPIPGGTVLDYQADMPRMPLFIRAGAIIPMQVSDGVTGHGSLASAGALTLVLYPEGETTRLLRPDSDQELTVTASRHIDATTVTIGPSAQRLVLRIKEPSRPVSLEAGREDELRVLPDHGTMSALDREATGWAFDAENGYLWVRLPASQERTTISYSTRNPSR